jgi:hypothetical protein
MLKRTKGRFLLSLLVITGFAGTVNNTALTKENRKLAVEHLKDSKFELQKITKGLSESQLNFKPTAGAPSIRDLFYQLLATESYYWDLLDRTMKGPPEKPSGLAFSDEDLLPGGAIAKADICFHPREQSWKNISAAQSAFKQTRAQYLKYVKTTTEDLRNQIINLPFGEVDSYQFILFVSTHSDKHLQEIHAVMADPSFPKK